MNLSWAGTTHLAQRPTTSCIESTFGLDPEEWMIVGLDIGGGQHEHGLRVSAVSRSQMPAGGDVLPLTAEANGGALPVTEFLIHDIDPYDFLCSITRLFELHLRLQDNQDLPLCAVAHVDLSCSPKTAA